jgi:hypothetical protein
MYPTEITVKHVPYPNLTMGEESTFYHDVRITESDIITFSHILGSLLEYTL